MRRTYEILVFVIFLVFLFVFVPRIANGMEHENPQFYTVTKWGGQIYEFETFDEWFFYSWGLKERLRHDGFEMFDKKEIDLKDFNFVPFTILNWIGDSVMLIISGHMTYDIFLFREVGTRTTSTLRYFTRAHIGVGL